MNKLAYKKYLKEVWQVLMDDKEFADKVFEAGTAFSEKVVNLLAICLIDESNLLSVNRSYKILVHSCFTSPRF